MDIDENTFKEFICTIIACIILLPFFIIDFTDFVLKKIEETFGGLI